MFKSNMFLVFKFITVLHVYLYLTVLNIFDCNGLNINTSDLERPGKNLCVSFQDVDCSNQVQYSAHVTKASCLMKYLNKTSEGCSDEEFKGHLDSEDKYGIVNLDRYLWFDMGISFPALNITLKNIYWERLKLRFLKVGSKTPQLCREFILSEDVDASSVISFDCLWGDTANAGQDFKLQYVIVTKDNRKYLHNYLFQYPKDTEVNENVALENYQFFLLMDETAFPYLSVKVQVPPSRLNISTANVTLLFKPDLESTGAPLENWSAGFTNKIEGEFVSVGTFNTDNFAGYYYFTASPLASACGNICTQSCTPTLMIADSRFGFQATFAMIMIASVLLLGLLGLIMWNKKYKKIINDADKPPNVLLVYESCYPSHVENIYKFKEFLEANCYIAPKLDLIDIPKSDTKNPWKWYYGAFEAADYVLVFASPDKSTDRGVHEDDVYHNLHTYAIKLLLVYLLHKHKFLVANVKLPGCSWNTLPSEVSIVEKRFSLPEKLSHFFKFLNIPPLKNGSSTFINALKQSRDPPKLSVTRPSAPLPLPFDAEDFDLNSEAREPLTVGRILLNLDNNSSSEEDEDEDEDFPNGLPINGLNL